MLIVTLLKATTLANLVNSCYSIANGDASPAYDLAMAVVVLWTVSASILVVEISLLIRDRTGHIGKAEISMPMIITTMLNLIIVAIDTARGHELTLLGDKV